MKNRTKSTKTPHSASYAEHKKSHSKLTASNKNHQSTKQLEPKKSSNRDRVLSISQLSKNNRHNMSQSQLHQQNSVVYIDTKDLGTSTQHTKSKIKNMSSSTRKSKEQTQIRNNLLQTFKLLQHRLHIKEDNSKQITTLGLSKSIYDIIRNSCAQSLTVPKLKGQSNGPTMNSFNNSGGQFHLNKQNIQENIHVPYKDRKDLLLKRVNDNSKPFASNHSSSLLEYFEEKFGSAAQDEQSLQRRLKMLEVLKRSQDVASKCSSHYSSSVNSHHDMGVKEAVIEKFKQKAKK